MSTIVCYEIKMAKSVINVFYFDSETEWKTSDSRLCYCLGSFNLYHCLQNSIYPGIINSSLGLTCLVIHTLLLPSSWGEEPVILDFVLPSGMEETCEMHTCKGEMGYLNLED